MNYVKVFYLFLFTVLLITIYCRLSYKEPFTNYFPSSYFKSNTNICANQGYPIRWCVNADQYNETSNTCICPPGQKIYKRYGRCLCQTYVG